MNDGPENRGLHQMLDDYDQALEEQQQLREAEAAADDFLAELEGLAFPDWPEVKKLIKDVIQFSNKAADMAGDRQERADGFRDEIAAHGERSTRAS